MHGLPYKKASGACALSALFKKLENDALIFKSEGRITLFSKLNRDA